MESPIICLNGEFVKSSEASLSPFDRSLLTGDGIFETLIAYDGIPFMTERHYQRLRAGAKRLGLQIPDADELSRAIRQTIKLNELEKEDQIRLRVTITGGNPTADTWMVSANKLPHFPHAAKVTILPYTRNENGALTGIKSTSYGENMLALREVKAKGINEGIFANTKGKLCEGTSTNIFVILPDGQLVTPPLSDGCLPGITRELVIELCHKEEIRIKERSIPIEDLAETKGAFLSSSLRGIQPISDLDGTSLDIDPNKIVTRLKMAYQNLITETEET